METLTATDFTATHDERSAGPHVGGGRHRQDRPPGGRPAPRPGAAGSRWFALGRAALRLGRPRDLGARRRGRDRRVRLLLPRSRRARRGRGRRGGGTAGSGGGCAAAQCVPRPGGRGGPAGRAGRPPRLPRPRWGGWGLGWAALLPGLLLA